MNSLSLNPSHHLETASPDEILISKNGVTIDKAHCTIIYNHRKISYNISSQNEDGSWNALNLNESQSYHIAVKIAVMLVKKNLLQKNTTPLCNASITDEGIHAFSKVYQHDEPEKTRDDYNEMVGYLHSSPDTSTIAATPIRPLSEEIAPTVLKPTVIKTHLISSPIIDTTVKKKLFTFDTTVENNESHQEVQTPVKKEEKGFFSQLYHLRMESIKQERLKETTSKKRVQVPQKFELNPMLGNRKRVRPTTTTKPQQMYQSAVAVPAHNYSQVNSFNMTDVSDSSDAIFQSFQRANQE